MKRGIALLAILMVSVVFITNPFGICNKTSAYYVNTQTIGESSIYAPAQATQGSMLVVTGGTFSNNGQIFSGMSLSNSNDTTQLTITEIKVIFAGVGGISNNQGVSSVLFGSTIVANTDVQVNLINKTADIKLNTPYSIAGGVKNIIMTMNFDKNAKNEASSIIFIMSDGSQKQIVIS